MKTLLVLIAALLATTAVDAGERYNLDKSSWRDVARFSVWMEACFETHYDCIGVPVPQVVYKSMRPGLLGQYKGGTIVYVNSRLSVLQTKATLHHEMIHYLQWINGLKVPGPAKEICAAEAEAFKLTDARWVRLGYPNKQRGAEWWKPYRHCHKYYKPNYKRYQSTFPGWA